MMVGSGKASPRMLELTAKYADLWNTGYMGKPETMIEPIAKIKAACGKVGRDPATMGITAGLGLWFPDLLERKPSFFDDPLVGTVPEIATAMKGYGDLGVRQIIFQCEPYTQEARRRLAEALKLFRDAKRS